MSFEILFEDIAMDTWVMVCAPSYSGMEFHLFGQLQQHDDKGSFTVRLADTFEHQSALTFHRSLVDFVEMCPTGVILIGIKVRPI